MGDLDNPVNNKFFDAKIVLLGDSSVGKTSIALRFAKGTFTGRSHPTIGASFLVKNLVMDDYRIKLQIWDTAGQERFRSLAPMYYRGAVSAILVYDLCSKISFSKMQDWVRELQTNVPEEIILVVVGNKLDKADQSMREIEYETGENYAKSVSAKFYEVSAKTNYGIDDVFLDIAKQLIDARKSGVQLPSGLAPMSPPSESGDHVNLQPRQPTGKPDGSTTCCK
mmetsp:Transcript_22633/g.25193  ORF Transcript_22633/g.25193 Transcript_22633/m.25193 type:complete len:224 (-) Transcript_22633:190-861(-)